MLKFYIHASSAQCSGADPASSWTPGPREMVAEGLGEALGSDTLASVDIYSAHCPFEGSPASHHTLLTKPAFEAAESHRDTLLTESWLQGLFTSSQLPEPVSSAEQGQLTSCVPGFRRWRPGKPVLISGSFHFTSLTRDVSFGLVENQLKNFKPHNMLFTVCSL